MEIEPDKKKFASGSTGLANILCAL